MALVRLVLRLLLFSLSNVQAGLVPTRTNGTIDGVPPGSMGSPDCEASANATIKALNSCGWILDDNDANTTQNLTVGLGTAVGCICAPQPLQIFHAGQSICAPFAGNNSDVSDYLDGLPYILDGCKEFLNPSTLNSGNSVNVGAIVGGVVGGVVLLMCLALGVWWYRRTPLDTPPYIHDRMATDAEFVSFRGEMRTPTARESSSAQSILTIVDTAVKESKQSIALPVPASPIHEVATDPAAWTINQTIVWLQSLSYPADVLLTFRDCECDGAYLQVLSRSRASCKEALKKDMGIEDVRTRVLLANSIVGLFEAAQGRMDGAVLPGYVKEEDA
ncbi:hypothetical protein BC830DRAFT_1113003 [Chytriomyces sp. MP71]|nr:hypothetical protein BC830DRAFT_1113003 [Chytriomyces sp. MP71]